MRILLDLPMFASLSGRRTPTTLRGVAKRAGKLNIVLKDVCKLNKEGCVANVRDIDVLSIYGTRNTP